MIRPGSPGLPGRSYEVGCEADPRSMVATRASGNRNRLTVLSGISSRPRSEPTEDDRGGTVLRLDRSAGTVLLSDSFKLTALPTRAAERTRTSDRCVFGTNRQRADRQQPYRARTDGPTHRRAPCARHHDSLDAPASCNRRSVHRNARRANRLGRRCGRAARRRPRGRERAAAAPTINAGTGRARPGGPRGVPRSRAKPPGKVAGGSRRALPVRAGGP